MTDLGEIDVWHSKPLDVHVWSEHPEINMVVDAVYDSLSDDGRLQISGKSNNSGKASGKVMLKVVLVDLYVAWKTDPTLCIGVARGNDAYNVNSRYNALYISSRITKIIDTLSEEEFIDFKGGSYNRTGTGWGSHTSRIRAAEKLRDMFSLLDIEVYELDLHHNRECIVLNDLDIDEDGEPIKTKSGAKKSKTIEYEDTPETEQMRADLTAYNDLLKETYIDIPSLEEPHITRTKSDGQVQVVPINQANKFVRRVFSRGQWDLNGRYYGGWWQQVSKDLRKQITINNKPTVEVDYKGLHVAILSAQKGIQDDPKDRYNLGYQILPQFDLEEQRAIVKLLVLTAINAKTEESAYSAFRNDRPTGSLQKKSTNDELASLLTAFIDKHPHLRDDLCSDQGIRLMKIDSQITTEVLKASTELKVPILSVHDSYIISVFDVGLLLELMREATIKVVGSSLAMEQEAPSYEDIIEIKAPNRVVGQDTFIDLYNETATINDKTIQYEERLLKFIQYRDTKYKQTYWLPTPPSNHY